MYDGFFLVPITCKHAINLPPHLLTLGSRPIVLGAPIGALISCLHILFFLPFTLHREPRSLSVHISVMRPAGAPGTKRHAGRVNRHTPTTESPVLAPKVPPRNTSPISVHACCHAPAVRKTFVKISALCSIDFSYATDILGRPQKSCRADKLIP